jgi:hypothetical protein
LAQEQERKVASYQISGERVLFTRKLVRGYVDFSFAPYHNEPDLGRCAASAHKHGGARSRCTAFARYVWSGYLELQPVGRGPLRHVFLFLEPKLFLGENVPQLRYTASSAPMAFERSVGLGLELTRNFELRATQHEVHWLGRYSRHLGTGDLRTDGPYGLYATVGVRWYFGGWGRARPIR